MGLSEINRLVDEGNSRKDYANAYAANYPVFLEAAELYKKAHDLCILSTEIGEPEETLLTSIYKFEELECRYYFYIKEEKYHKARKLNELQKKSIDKFLNQYNISDLYKNQYKDWYRYIKGKVIVVEMMYFQTLAKPAFKNGNWGKAIYYYRRGEDAHLKIKINELSEEELKIYNKNRHITALNISQCQLLIDRAENFEDELLTKYTIRGLLKSISEIKEIQKISDDPIYNEGEQISLGYLKEILKETKLSWQFILEYTQNDALVIEFMKEIDNARFLSIEDKVNMLFSPQDRFIFYTHGFNTRGKWKEIFTEEITSRAKKRNIWFTMRPWDYGLFVIQLLLPFARKRVVREFWEEYQRISDRYGRGLIKCLVAHSFGTYITGTALQEYESIKFERIIYMGAIIKSNYDWDKLKRNNQCEKILFEQSTNDFVLTIAKFYLKLPWIKWIGYAGKVGFDKSYDYMTVYESQNGHSDMINESNMRGRWFDFLVS